MYYNPVEVIETNNWQKECINAQKSLGIQNPLVITSNGNLKRQKLSTVFNPKSIFSNILPNPTFKSCKEAIDFNLNKEFDGVITIGGGSVMDTAKAVMASMGTGIIDLAELLAITEPYEKITPSIFIPTTHGTGGEVTMWGTVWNMDKKKKYSISHPDLYPNVAILDGNLTLSLPLDISIITMMDALSHSFEAIWNKNANSTSTSYAIEAITLIIENIEKFKNNPYTLKTRKKLLIAANKAGLAISNTKTAAAHSISYPLTIHYGMPHGVASSITLIPLLKTSRESVKDSLEKICYNNNLTFEQLIESIRLIPQNILSFTLKDWGIPRDQLPKLVDESFTKGRMDNNIVELTKHKVKSILEQVYN